MAGPVSIAQVVEVGDGNQFHERGETGRSSDAVDFGGACGGDLLDHARQVFWRVGADLEAYRIGKTTGTENFLHFIGKVDRIFFLHGDITVAGDAECGGCSDFFTGKKLLGVGGDEVLGEHKGEGVGSGADRHKAVDRIGNGNECEAGSFVFGVD